MQNTAIITGASQGIGAAIAHAFSAQGVHPILLARNETGLQQIAGQIKAKGGNCSWFACDVSQTTSIDAVLNQILDQFNPPPLILVNNAGWGGPFHRTDEVSEEEWDQVFDTNIKGPFWFCKRLLPLMKKNGFGRIINIASIYGAVGGAFSSTYAASKHALVGYTKSVAKEWGDSHITCNVISPGYVQTAMGLREEEGVGPKILDQIPAKRQGTPEEIARLALFLAEPNSGYINGANLVIDGGLLSGL